MTLARLENFTEEDTALLAYLLREAANCDALPRQKRARYGDFAEWLEIRMQVRSRRNFERRSHRRWAGDRASLSASLPKPLAATL